MTSADTPPPNDRMLQQSEWDEEYGLYLHDFDARIPVPRANAIRRTMQALAGFGGWM